MPYIKPERRQQIIFGSLPLNAGELNYQFTILLKLYYTQHGLNYQVINDIVGALEGAKAEFQRRVVAPYEDSKIKLNGDVYGPQ